MDYLKKSLYRSCLKVSNFVKSFTTINIIKFVFCPFNGPLYLPIYEYISVEGALKVYSCKTNFKSNCSYFKTLKSLLLSHAFRFFKALYKCVFFIGVNYLGIS